MAAQFVVELAAPTVGTDEPLRTSQQMSGVEQFEATDKTFLVFDAKNIAVIETYFYTKGISPLSVKEVGFVNSPTVGGGPMAGPNPQAGHQVFVIERPIPGVSGFPLEVKEKISRASNAAVAQMDGTIEWDHSYLTSDGTYCIYRAIDSATVEKHGALANAPIQTITPVAQIRNSN